VQSQTSFLAYMDAFWVLMLISLAAVPPGANPAQGQAGRRRPRGTLRPIVRRVAKLESVPLELALLMLEPCQGGRPIKVGWREIIREDIRTFGMQLRDAFADESGQRIAETVIRLQRKGALH
jgi:hypothetical protein